MRGLPFMQQWQRDEIAEAERLDAEYLARRAETRAAYARWVADRNGDRLARGHVRPTEWPPGGATVTMLALAGFAVAMIALGAFVVQPVLFRLFDLLTGWV